MDATAMNALLAKQKAAHLRDGAPSAEARIDRLDRCIRILVDNREAIEEALNTDFGSRSREATAFTDISASIGPLKHAKENLKAWMKTEKRKPSPAILGLFGAKAEVRFQPKGVVGVISPWNFPVNLTFAPLAGIIAAGNRAMIKPSEFTPVTSELMKTMFASAFSEEEIAVVTGGPEVGQAFSSLAAIISHSLFMAFSGRTITLKSMIFPSRSKRIRSMPLTWIPSTVAVNSSRASGPSTSSRT